MPTATLSTPLSDKELHGGLHRESDVHPGLLHATLKNLMVSSKHVQWSENTSIYEEGNEVAEMRASSTEALRFGNCACLYIPVLSLLSAGVFWKWTPLFTYQ
eukprot:5895978-Amphidinium_carterae.2